MSIVSTEVRKGPGIKDRQISPTAGIKPHKLDHSYRYINSDCKGLCVGMQSDGTVASEVDAEINYARMSSDNLSFEKYNLNTQVSGFPLPQQGTNGLDLGVCNQTSAQGAQYCFGGNHARGRFAFVVGTDEFFAKCTMNVADFSGVDIWFGFRKVEAHQAVIANYAEYATILLDGTAASGVTTAVVKSTTESATLSAVTTTLTGLTATVSEGANFDMEVRVNKGGYATYLVNGAVSSAAVAFPFTAATVVVPFIAYINTADVAGEVALSRFVCGLREANVR